MSLNSVPASERVHIGIFGKRNVGKSSIINAITNQSAAIVSDIKGTTTDPVLKSMEILPLGPVTLIDTPGIDDKGELGELRVKRALRFINKTDIAVLVCDCTEKMGKEEYGLIEKFKAKNIPYVIVMNKCDLLENVPENTYDTIYISAAEKKGIEDLKKKLAGIVSTEDLTHKIVGDILEPDDIAVLVVPIDSAAPKGRLILPQQQTIRDILETGAIAVVSRDTELRKSLASLQRKPKIVITDSQAFNVVSKITPDDILLTSFSILFARYKGNLTELVKGAAAVERLKDGDTVLISEGCTHHRQCDDIGTVKIPKWLREYTGKNINFHTSSGGEFPDDLSQYSLIIHCGGCTLNEREMKYRVKCAVDAGVPIVNYGIFISYVHGILKRAVMPFKELNGIF